MPSQKKIIYKEMPEYIHCIELEDYIYKNEKLILRKRKDLLQEEKVTTYEIKKTPSKELKR